MDAQKVLVLCGVDTLLHPYVQQRFCDVIQNILHCIGSGFEYVTSVESERVIEIVEGDTAWEDSAESSSIHCKLFFADGSTFTCIYSEDEWDDDSHYYYFDRYVFTDSDGTILFRSRNIQTEVVAKKNYDDDDTDEVDTATFATEFSDTKINISHDIEGKEIYDRLGFSTTVPYNRDIGIRIINMCSALKYIKNVKNPLTKPCCD